MNFAGLHLLTLPLGTQGKNDLPPRFPAATSKMAAFSPWPADCHSCPHREVEEEDGGRAAQQPVEDQEHLAGHRHRRGHPEACRGEEEGRSGEEKKGGAERRMS